MMKALREVLASWLGTPKWKQTEGRITFLYRYSAEGLPPVPMKLKVEMNTREHFAVYGLQKAPFKVESRWFERACGIQTYELDELLGTKLRALYQRKYARDLAERYERRSVMVTSNLIFSQWRRDHSTRSRNRTSFAT